MAYLKGGTYIDGDIFAEGKLRVSAIDFGNGNNPPILSNKRRKIDFLMKFAQGVNDTANAPSVLEASAFEAKTATYKYKVTDTDDIEIVTDDDTDDDTTKITTTSLILSSANEDSQAKPDNLTIGFERDNSPIMRISRGKVHEHESDEHGYVKESAATGVYAQVAMDVDADHVIVNNTKLYLWDNPTINKGTGGNNADNKWHYYPQDVKITETVNALFNEFGSR